MRNADYKESSLGLIFGRLTIISEQRGERGAVRSVTCRCECGDVSDYSPYVLKGGTTVDCGYKCSLRERATLTKEKIQNNIHINENGCWIWLGGQHMDGYGQYCSRTAPPKLVHRVAYTLWKGPLTEGKPYILHRCPNASNRLCCNPEHLYAGTQQNNMDDKVREGSGKNGYTGSRGDEFKEQLKSKLRTRMLGNQYSRKYEKKS